jgi:lipopolysaccharide/colanic/teichoic acid biosynthesis glycosyltransferase
LKAKRTFDFFFAAIGLIALLPLFVLLAIAIKMDSRGPVFYRQERVGQFGRIFRIHKFRTMVIEGEKTGLQITVGADSRITRVGRLIRKMKFDELAQLLDVVKGDMSLVGPRPEVPRYVACYPNDIRDLVLSVRPGITDKASIEFKDESIILGQSIEPERVYIEKILPIKLSYYVDYVNNNSVGGDIKIILATFLVLFNVRLS